MRIVDQVFGLVHCLTVSEKRQFKIFLSKYTNSKDGNVARLFDAFNNMTKFEEDKLKSILKGDKILQNLSYEKHRLQNVIIDFLTSKNQNSSLELELNMIYSQVCALEMKRQYSLTLKVIEKGVKIAESYERNEFLFPFLRKKHEILGRLGNFKYDDIKKLNQQIIDVGDKIRIEGIYYTLKKECAWINRMMNAIPISEIQVVRNKMLSNPYFQDETNAISFNAKAELFFAKVFLYYNYDNERFLEALEKLRKLFKENEVQLKVRYRNYIGILFYLIEYFVNCREYEKVLQQIEELIVFSEESKEIDSNSVADLKQDVNYILFNIAFQTHNYLLLEKALEKNRGSFVDFLNYADRSKDIYFYMETVLAFYKQDFEACMDWELQQLREKESLTNNYHNYLSKLLTVISLYELNQISLMRSQFNKLYVFSRKIKIKTKFVKVSLKILRKLSNEPSSNFALFKKDLRQIPDSEDTMYFGSEIFKMWLESKINETPLTQIIEKRKTTIEEEKYLNLMMR